MDNGESSAAVSMRATMRDCMRSSVFTEQSLSEVGCRNANEQRNIKKEKYAIQPEGSEITCKGGKSMGNGYVFKCKKCNKKYSVTPGIGSMFPEVYQNCLQAVKEGKYGEERKKIALSEEFIAVDAEKCVFQCEECGCWTEELSLSLYRPKNPEAIPDKEYGKTVREWGFVPYVMPFELEEDYILIMEYQHICKHCNGRMRRIDLSFDSSLPCPRCHTENIVTDLLMWD